MERKYASVTHSRCSTPAVSNCSIRRVRIFEYGGPMIHAKTLVADGWWSKVGSTNLNFSSLYANWEIDLVAETTGFASQMEQLFEEDLAGAREVHLVRAGRDQKVQVQPERPIDTTDRRAREGAVGSGTGSAGTITRVGSAAVQKSGAPLNTQQYALAAATSGALLGSNGTAHRTAVDAA